MILIYFKPVKTVKQNYWVTVIPNHWLHTATHYAISRWSELSKSRHTTSVSICNKKAKKKPVLFKNRVNHIIDNRRTQPK